jgi:hypothetical protein
MDPGVQIETLQHPSRYSAAQLDRACRIALLLDRGKLILVEPPQPDRRADG